MALRLVVALAAAKVGTLTSLARALGVPHSSAKRALEILVDDELARKRGTRYELATTAAVAPVTALAAEVTDPLDQIRVAAGASGQVDFIGQDSDAVAVFFARGSDPILESRLSRVLLRPTQRLGKQLLLHSHDELMTELKEQPSLRGRYLRLEPIYGDRVRAFPNRRLRRSQPGRLLGHPHPGLSMPSNRALGRLRKRFGVRGAKLFGSAVRSDFRADSDVDVAIELEDRPTLAVILDLETELERIFDRDVDLVLKAQAKPAVRAAIDREGVDLIK